MVICSRNVIIIIIIRHLIVILILVIIIIIRQRRGGPDVPLQAAGGLHRLMGLLPPGCPPRRPLHGAREPPERAEHVPAEPRAPPRHREHALGVREAEGHERPD